MRIRVGDVERRTISGEGETPRQLEVGCRARAVLASLPVALADELGVVRWCGHRDPTAAPRERALGHVTTGRDGNVHRLAVGADDNPVGADVGTVNSVGAGERLVQDRGERVGEERRPELRRCAQRREVCTDRELGAADPAVKEACVALAALCIAMAALDGEIIADAHAARAAGEAEVEGEGLACGEAESVFARNLDAVDATLVGGHEQRCRTYIGPAAHGEERCRARREGQHRPRESHGESMVRGAHQHRPAAGQVDPPKVGLLPVGAGEQGGRVGGRVDRCVR